MSQTKAQLIEGNAASELTAARTLLGAGSASAPSLTATGDTNTGIFFPTADTIALAEGGVEALRIDSSGNLAFNSGYGSVEVAYGCRAWVNFNGTGTVAIRASGNVSSITDNGEGLWTVNMSSALVDANYMVCASSGEATDTASVFAMPVTSFTTSAFSLRLRNNNATQRDSTYIGVAIFR